MGEIENNNFNVYKNNNKKHVLIFYCFLFIFSFFFNKKFLKYENDVQKFQNVSFL